MNQWHSWDGMEQDAIQATFVALNEDDCQNGIYPHQVEPPFAIGLLVRLVRVVRVVAEPSILVILHCKILILKRLLLCLFHDSFGIGPKLLQFVIAAG